MDKERFDMVDSSQSEALLARQVDHAKTDSKFGYIHLLKPLASMLFEAFAKRLVESLSNIEQLGKFLSTHFVDSVHALCFSFWPVGACLNREWPLPVDPTPFHVPHYTDQRYVVSTTNRLPYDSFRALDMLATWAQASDVSTLTASTLKVTAW
jgi:hypothetical protein